MLKNKHIYFLGYSGHAYVAIDVAKSNGFEIKGYFDRVQSIQDPYDIPYSGSENEASFKDLVKESYVFPAMGSNSIRARLCQFLTRSNIKQVALVDPSAHISGMATIGVSSLINPNACINSLARIGKGCIVNTGAVIEHECSIGDYSHIGPGAVLAGNVRIGINCFIGANAVVREGVSISDNAIIGAGAVVLKDIKKRGTWVGNPAKIVTKK